MAAPVFLRDDFDSAALRLLALAEICDGGSRGAAARIGDVGRQTGRDWVLRFNAAGPDRLVDGKAPGRLPTLDGAQHAKMSLPLRGCGLKPSWRGHPKIPPPPRV